MSACNQPGDIILSSAEDGSDQRLVLCLQRGLSDHMTTALNPTKKSPIAVGPPQPLQQVVKRSVSVASGGRAHARVEVWTPQLICLVRSSVETSDSASSTSAD